MTVTAIAPGARRWSMTIDALTALQVEAARLARDADRTGGYVTSHVTGEPDAPSLIPNIDGQRLVRQLTGIRAALARASVETDEGLAVIGRRVTLEDADRTRSLYELVIPGDGHAASGRVSVESPLGRAIYGRQAGDVVRVDSPDGAWTATVVAVE
jgi:hypothetical protein